MADLFEKAYRFVSNPEAATIAGIGSLGAKAGAALGGAACGPACAVVGKLAGGVIGTAASKYAISRAKRAWTETEKAKEAYGIARARVSALEHEILRGETKPAFMSPQTDRRARKSGKPRGVVKKRRGLAKKRALKMAR
jgi:hypothetical protein